MGNIEDGVDEDMLTDDNFHKQLKIDSSRLQKLRQMLNTLKVSSRIRVVRKLNAQMQMWTGLCLQIMQLSPQLLHQQLRRIVAGK